MTDFLILLIVVVLALVVRSIFTEPRTDSFDDSYRGEIDRWSARNSLGPLSKADRDQIKRNMQKKKVRDFWRIR